MTCGSVNKLKSKIEMQHFKTSVVLALPTHQIGCVRLREVKRSSSCLALFPRSCQFTLFNICLSADNPDKQGFCNGRHKNFVFL